MPVLLSCGYDMGDFSETETALAGLSLAYWT
jgi:hypothetical protein